MSWRPRFSLRTLAIFLLLVTSGMGLWWHWGPWVRVLTAGGPDDYMNCAAFSSDGLRLATASHAPKGGGGPDEKPSGIRVWDLRRGAAPRPLEGHGSFVEALAFSPEGDRLFSYSQDETVRIWDPSTGACRHVLRGETYYLHDVAFSLDGRRIVTSGLRTSGVGTYFGPTDWIYEDAVRVWDARTGECLNSVSVLCTALAVSPDGRRMATALRDGIVKVWGLDGRAELVTMKRHEPYAGTVVWSRDGRRILTLTPRVLYADEGVSHTARVWDASTGECLRVFGGPKERVVGADISPDGQRVVLVIETAAGAPGIGMWSVATGERLAGLPHVWVEGSHAFSPDGRRVIMCGVDTSGDDYRPMVWIGDARSGEEIARLESPEADEIFFSPDGRIFAAGSMDGLTAWRRTRPEPWWGVFRLWEFWLAAAFAGGFLWSVLCDRRCFAASG